MQQPQQGMQQPQQGMQPQQGYQQPQQGYSPSPQMQQPQQGMQQFPQQGMQPQQGYSPQVPQQQLGPVKVDKGSVTIKLKQAKDLKAADSNGKSDPYVQINHGGKKWKSKVIKKTLTPVWNENYSIEMKDIDQNTTILLELFDKDNIGKDDPLGQIAIPVCGVTSGVELTKWYKLEKTTKGEIEVGLLTNFTLAAKSTTPTTMPIQQPIYNPNQPMQQQPIYNPQQPMQQQPMYNPNQPMQQPMYNPQQPMQQQPMYNPQQPMMQNSPMMQHNPNQPMMQQQPMMTNSPHQPVMTNFPHHDPTTSRFGG